MFALLLALLSLNAANEECILVDSSTGRKYDFTPALEKSIEQGYTYAGKSGSQYAYVSFCRPINGTVVGCPEITDAFGIYKYADGHCVSLGNKQEILGGKDPYLSLTNGGTCDLGRQSSGTVALTCDKNAGLGSLGFFRFNEFCALNAFGSTNITC